MSVLQAAYNDLALTNSRLRAEIERLGKETAELRAELYWERLTAALRALENKPSVEAPEMCWHTENKPRTDHDEELWEEAFAEGWDRGRSTMRIENERLEKEIEEWRTGERP